MKHVTFVGVAFLTLVGLLVCGCGKEEKRIVETPPKLTIAVIPKGTTHSFWKSVHAGARKAEQEFGAYVMWQGPHKENERQMQIQVVQNFISRKVDAIVLAPLDDTALVAPVEQAIARGIKVVIIDSDLNSDKFSSFVATDNYEGGRLCARRLCQVMDGTGKVIMLRYCEGSASTAKREQGFMEGLATYGPGVVVISSNQYAGATMAEAFEVSKNLLNRFPDAEGVFCPNESTTHGMLRALQTSRKAGRIKFVGFDANEELVSCMRDDEIHGLAVQNPFNMGYLGVKAAVDALGGTTVEKRVNTGVTMVTREDIEKPEIKALLEPDLDKWLPK